MKVTINKENKISKKDRVIIKCKNCGFKYYDGDTHKCIPVGQSVNDEEKSKERKIPIKSQKESFKGWNNN